MGAARPIWQFLYWYSYPDEMKERLEHRKHFYLSGTIGHSLSHDASYPTLQIDAKFQRSLSWSTGVSVERSLQGLQPGTRVPMRYLRSAKLCATKPITILSPHAHSFPSV